MLRIAALAVIALLPACENTAPLTLAEQNEALSESVDSAKADQFASDVVEIHTHFTLGQAAKDAALELHDWLQSQIPCSTVTVEENTITVDFGTLDDECTYNGHTYAGVASVTIDRADEGQVEVHHDWTGLTNGVVTLDGTADVSWDHIEGTRHVVHDVVWQTPKHGDVHATGDRTQSLLDPEQGLQGGILVAGDREWETDKGVFHLDINDVEMLGQDPVPQAGEYVLTLPNGKIATLAFERVDEDTIQVTLTGPRRTKTWLVSKDGEVEE